MKKSMQKIALIVTLMAGLVLSAALSPLAVQTAYANEPEVNNDDRGDGYSAYFDIAPRKIEIRAGESARIDYFFSRYDFTYFVSHATSKKTYCDCTWKKGSSFPVLYIGADEQPGKSVYFNFYVDEEKAIGSVRDTEHYTVVEVCVLPSASSTPVYTQPAAAPATSVSAPITNKTSGTLSLIRDNTVAMLYDQKGVALASFSVSDGGATMPTLSLGAVSGQGKAKYFTVNTPGRSAKTVMISDSDKTVMKSKGYAGVILNGTAVNW